MADLEGRGFAGLPFARDLSQRERAVLEGLQTDRRVARGAVVRREGAPADAVYAVVSGALSVFKRAADGRNQVVGFLMPGDVLGVVHRGGAISTAVAMVETRLAAIDRPAFEDLCDRHPRIPFALLTLTANDLSEAQDHLLLLGRKTAEERVATFLLKLHSRQCDRGFDPAAPIWLPMRRADIANHLGLRLETVSRVLRKLERDGLIDSPNRGDLVIRDRDRIQAMA